MRKIAVYPGSFDPVTYGHLDIVRRACRIFDHVIVAVLDNPQKKYTFPVEERKALVKECLKHNSRAEVDSFSGLLVEYLARKKTHVVIRGLRAVSDLDYEFQIASTNRTLYPRIETVFLMPGKDYAYLSSSMVKEVAALKGNLKKFIPPSVEKALHKRCAP